MSRAIQISATDGPQSGSREPDRRIAALAARQHGLVTRDQLTQLGVRPRTIGHRLERGQLHRVHRGVYAVGHPLVSRHGRWMAAVLAGGEGAILSHRSAAALWGLRPNSSGPMDITVSRGGARPGIRFHRLSLPGDEVAVREGIPVTTVGRTLFDLALVVSVRRLERAINEAEVLRLWDEVSLAALAERYPGRPGTRTVRDALKARQQEGPTITRNDFEERFLELVRKASLPSPELNAPLEANGRSYEVDFLWRRERVIVELDGRATHHTVKAFEQDRERDRFLQVAGWRTVRITWRQLDGVEGDLRALLGTV